MKLKKFSTYFILFSLFVSGCAVNSWNTDPWFSSDKLYHFTVAGGISAGVTLAAEKNGVHESSAPIVGISTAISLGATKEYYDSEGTGTFWSWKDMVWNMLGATAGSYLIRK